MYSHECIPCLHFFGRVKVFEYMVHGPLDRYLRRSCPPKEVLLGMGRDVAAGMAYLADRGFTVGVRKLIYIYICFIVVYICIVLCVLGENVQCIGECVAVGVGVDVCVSVCVLDLPGDFYVLTPAQILLSQLIPIASALSILRCVHMIPFPLHPYWHVHSHSPICSQIFSSLLFLSTLMRWSVTAQELSGRGILVGVGHCCKVASYGMQRDPTDAENHAVAPSVKWAAPGEGNTGDHANSWC